MRRVSGELAELTATAADEAERLLISAKRALRRAKGPGRQASAHQDRR